MEDRGKRRLVDFEGVGHVVKFVGGESGCMGVLYAGCWTDANIEMR